MSYIIGLARNVRLQAITEFMELSMKDRFAQTGCKLIERLRALALQGTELAHAQVDTLRTRLLKLAAVVIRNTRRIRLYFASNWPSAPIFAQAMKALGAT